MVWAGYWPAQDQQVSLSLLTAHLSIRTKAACSLIRQISVIWSETAHFSMLLCTRWHAIGFGILWTTDFIRPGSQSNYVMNSGRYTGEYALEIYRQEFVKDAEFIPVELGGGEGTANSHWDEPWPGGSSDLMTGYLGPYPITLSDTTIASFADIGYLTTVTHAVSEASTVWLFLLSIGLVARRHRQRSDVGCLTEMSSMKT